MSRKKSPQYRAALRPDTPFEVRVLHSKVTNIGAVGQALVAAARSKNEAQQALQAEMMVMAVSR